MMRASSRRQVGLFRRCAASAGAAALALGGLAGCGGTSGDATAGAPGVTEDTILLGSTQALSGPAAPYAAIGKAMTAYFDYLNEHGGVHGRSIELKIADDAYNPSNTASQTRKLVLQDNVFAMAASLGTPTVSAVSDFLTQNKVPNLFPTSGSRVWNQPDKHPAAFGFSPNYTIEGKVLGTYISEKFPDKTVCFFGQADDFGADGLAGLEKVVKVAQKQEYSPANTDIAPQIGALKSAGCQVTVSFTTAGFSALTLGTAARQDFKTQWVFTGSGFDIPTLEGFLKEDTIELTEGAITSAYLPVSTAADNSWIKLFKEINQDYNGNARFDFNTVYGMSVAYTVAQALERAGEDLTRDSLVDAVAKGGIRGPMLTPFQYSEDNHSGASGTQVYVARAGVLEPASPIYTTDDGDGDVVESTTPPAEAPQDGLPQ
ncbi:ABC transporter substrate-binding protein [Nocardioides vastitatis]|uniref:ABC transporter substrate-binding protein n=2 Tax=Nocardioidaceae TaxID=85015 RepID=A0ABW0ZEB9_9ACTN